MNFVTLDIAKITFHQAFSIFSCACLEILSTVTTRLLEIVQFHSNFNGKFFLFIIPFSSNTSLFISEIHLEASLSRSDIFIIL
jgi:hypothetical protein